MCPPEAAVEPEELLTALRLLQSLDPTGVGARDAAECLLLQLQSLERSPVDGDTKNLPSTFALARRIVHEHLPLLAAREFSKLRKLLGCSDEELRTAHRLIRSLNPRPGRHLQRVEQITSSRMCSCAKSRIDGPRCLIRTSCPGCV